MRGVNFTYPLYAFRSSGSKSDTYVGRDHGGGQIRVSDTCFNLILALA